MRRLIVAIAISTIITAFFVGSAAAQQQPEFRQGFKALADQIPEVVGQPLEEEHWDANGDSKQRTTTGLMVWRKYDRWTAFTNGFMTWVLGPYGVQSRLNTDLYPWEQVPPGPTPVVRSCADCPTAEAPGQPANGGSGPAPAAAPIATPAPAPAAVPTTVGLPPYTPPGGAPAAPAAPSAPAAPAPQPAPAAVSTTTYQPDVRAMDADSAGRGVMIKMFVDDIDREWAQVWGWRPHRPTTIYLYGDGQRFAYGLMQVLGQQLSPYDFDRITASGATASGVDKQNGGWAVLVNTGYRLDLEDWADTTRANVLHEYALTFLNDQVGNAGPTWFREGFAEWTTYSKVTSTLGEQSITGYTTTFLKNGTLPSLPYLTTNWDQSVAGSTIGSSEATYGTAYFAVKYLAGRAGGMPLLIALQRTAAGMPFDAALESASGFSILRLDSEFKSIIPQ